MPLTRDEFRSLFAEHRDPLFRFLHRVTGNAADADDLLQEAFLTLWRKRRRYQARGSAAEFLRTIAFRAYLSRTRREVRRRSLASRAVAAPVETPPDDRVAVDEETRVLLTRVRAAMERLPAPLREAFDLYRVLGLSVREIGDWTDTPRKTVETRIRRATLDVARALHPALPERCAHP